MFLRHFAYSGTAYFGQNECPCGIWLIVVTAYFGQNECPCGVWLIAVLLTLDKMNVLAAFGL